MNAKANARYANQYAVIGQKLAELREKRGYSQNQLAKEAGVTQGTISSMEAGKPFELGNLLAVLEVLRREIGDFLQDCGFSARIGKRQKYKFVIELEVNGLISYKGNAEGPGIKSIID